MSVTDWSYVKFLLSDHDYLFAIWIYHQCIKVVAIACFQQADINIFFFKFRYKDICVSWSKNSAHCTSFRLKKVFAIKTSINATKIVVTFVATVFLNFLFKVVFVAAIPYKLERLVKKDWRCTLQSMFLQEHSRWFLFYWESLLCLVRKVKTYKFWYFYVGLFIKLNAGFPGLDDLWILSVVQNLRLSDLLF